MAMAMVAGALLAAPTGAGYGASSSASHLGHRISSTSLLSPPLLAKRLSLLTIHCSCRPQKKSTAHHNKSRPKKHNPYDKNRKPARYPALPKAPPPFGFDTASSPEDPSTEAAVPPAASSS